MGALARSAATFELVDIAAYNLPLLDEPFPPSTGKYTKPHTQVWAAKIGSFDCGQSVVPGYETPLAPGPYKTWTPAFHE